MIDFVGMISNRFGISHATAMTLIRSAPNRYKVYAVKKRSGSGVRIIAQPAREVKALQRFIVSSVINNLPIHHSAVAYRKGIGIKDNAARHIENNYILKMDFKDFFPSITSRDFILHLTKFMPPESSTALKHSDFEYISLACFRRTVGSGALHLTIGGPSSPFISNTIMYDFDDHIYSIASNLGITYTRYADDLTFSTTRQGILTKIESAVVETLENLAYPRLAINSMKTIYSSKKHHRRVTGLVLSSQGKVSLGRDRKRTISACLNRARYDLLTQDEATKLGGLLSFVADVEPTFIRTLTRKYGADLLRRVMGHK